MANQSFQSDKNEINVLRNKFYEAAQELVAPCSEIDGLWLTFKKLLCPAEISLSSQTINAVINDLLTFCEQAAKSGVDFKYIFYFIKSIRELLCAFYNDLTAEDLKSFPLSHHLAAAFDDLEYNLLNIYTRLATRPYQKKLREANRYILHEKRRYYTIFNRMREPAFIIDHELRLVETNRSFVHFFRLSGKCHIGKKCLDIIGDDTLTPNKIQQVLDAQTSFPAIEATLKIDDKEKNVVISGTFLGEINNEFSGGIIIIQDITHQKNYEKALRNSEGKYRSLIENVPDVTWRADQNGTIYFMSQNIEKICGYKPEEMLGAWPKGRFSKIHPEDLDYFRNEFEHFFSSHLPNRSSQQKCLRQLPDANNDEHRSDGKIYDVRYRFKHKDGHWIWLHGRASNIYEQDGTWFTDGVLSDITELKKAEDELERHHFRLSELVDERTVELRQANENLEQEISIRMQAEHGLMELTRKLKQSNEELEEFAHVASHDLKEPLMLITAFSKRLLDKYSPKLDERGQEYLRRITVSITQMQQLIDGLLELSRVTSCKKPFERLNLTEIVNEVSQNFEERFKQNRGEIKFSELGKLTGDKTQIRQLFQNIIANAIKYSNTDKAPLVTIKSSIVDGSFYQITIQDNGIGFDPIYAEKIFHPLTRLHGHKEYEGTGIGLATCQKIVLRHGGKIEAKSTPGKGATFIIKLPVNPDNKG